MKKKYIYLSASFFILAVIIVVFMVQSYLSTPAHIRYPKFEHYHMRTQILVNGSPVDFSRSEFQENYNASSCSAELPEEPVDFHDGMDQMTHVHWQNLTGGEFLKYYGWNFIGGKDDVLGTRYDGDMMNEQSVKSHGNLLPAITDGASFYIYIGNADSYEMKDWDEFLTMDMEKFFDKESNLPSSSKSSGFSLKNLFTNNVYAHSEVKQGHNSPEESDKNEVELAMINNLIGNMVIFVQKDEPTNQQIKDRFNNLVPLSESTCGG